LLIGGAMIVDGVSLEIQRGEFLTLIGPNGAGKTSFFNLVSGLYRPSGGRIEIAGRDMTAASAARRARAGLGRSFQTSTIYPGLTVFENIRLAAQAGGHRNLALWRNAADPGEATRAQQALVRVGLRGLEERRAGTLGQGDKRKVELAMLLAGGFEVLLLDEPTAGLSVEDIPALLQVIKTIHEEEGKTVLMVEHRMDVIGGLSDRIAVMHHARLLACAPPAVVMADPAVQEAYLGEPL
jgi:branched-chain amino acid transport system ATP-binding protein